MELLLNEASEHSFIYDAYGNMLSATDGLGIRTEYAYDSVLHQYPVQATRSGGGTSYTSSATWNYTTGTKETETDINGNVMRYTYDEWQRVASVRSPYDTGTVPAVSYSYGIDGSGRWYAVTDNKVGFDPSDSHVIKFEYDCCNSVTKRNRKKKVLSLVLWV